VQESPFLHFKL